MLELCIQLVHLWCSQAMEEISECSSPSIHPSNHTCFIYSFDGCRVNRFQVTMLGQLCAALWDSWSPPDVTPPGFEPGTVVMPVALRCSALTAAPLGSPANRWQVHRFECVKNCNAAGFFTLNRFPCVSGMVHHPKDIQPTWHNFGKHWSQHGPASLWNAFDTLKSCQYYAHGFDSTLRFSNLTIIASIWFHYFTLA